MSCLLPFLVFVIGHIARYAPSSKFQNQQNTESKLPNLFFHHCRKAKGTKIWIRSIPTRQEKCIRALWTPIPFRRASTPTCSNVAKKPVVLGKYRSYLLLERGLSPNTREAYCRDVKRFLEYVEENHLEVGGLTLNDFHRFTWTLSDLGISERSLARVLSGVRSFFHFLQLDGYIEKNPLKTCSRQPSANICQRCCRWRKSMPSLTPLTSDTAMGSATAP